MSFSRKICKIFSRIGILEKKKRKFALRKNVLA